ADGSAIDAVRLMLLLLCVSAHAAPCSCKLLPGDSACSPAGWTLSLPDTHCRWANLPPCFEERPARRAATAASVRCTVLLDQRSEGLTAKGRSRICESL